METPSSCLGLCVIDSSWNVVLARRLSASASAPTDPMWSIGSSSSLPTQHETSKEYDVQCGVLSFSCNTRAMAETPSSCTGLCAIDSLWSVVLARSCVM